jgi:hypothetical protein
MGKGLGTSLWIAQGLLALMFAGGGLWKLATPAEQLAQAIPWTGEVSPVLLYASAAFDILGGVGVLLPSVTRVMPGLTVLAALGCAALMGSAAVFHLSRSEAGETPLNFALMALACFVAWGRHTKALIAPRTRTMVQL